MHHLTCTRIHLQNIKKRKTEIWRSKWVLQSHRGGEKANILIIFSWVRNPCSFLKYKFIYFNWRLITLQYYIGFAIHQHESAMGVYGWPRGMVQGGRWEGVSGWGTRVILALNPNAELELKSMGRESPLKVTCGHWVILAPQNSIVRQHFRPQRSRKQSPVISDSEWRLVALPPGSCETSLVWCFDWAGLESVPPTNSIFFCPKAEFLFHVTLQAMKQKALRFQDPCWRNVWSLSSLITKLLKESFHTYQRGKGIMMIAIFPVLYRTGGQRC